MFIDKAQNEYFAEFNQLDNTFSSIENIDRLYNEMISELRLNQLSVVDDSQKMELVKIINSRFLKYPNNNLVLSELVKFSNEFPLFTPISHKFQIFENENWNSIKPKTSKKKKLDKSRSKLTLNQTILLIHYLQKSNLIANNLQVSATELAGIFETLTGISSTSLRPFINDTKITEIKKSKNSEREVNGNLNQLRIEFQKILSDIDEDLAKNE
jgi:hypothetical protein